MITTLRPQHRLLIIVVLLVGGLALTLWVAFTTSSRPSASAAVAPVSCTGATDLGWQFCPTDGGFYGDGQAQIKMTGEYWILRGDQREGVIAYKAYHSADPPVIWTNQTADRSWNTWGLVLYLVAASAFAIVLWRTRLPAPPMPIRPTIDYPPPPPPPAPVSHPPMQRRPHSARKVQLAASTSSGITGLTADRGRIGRFEVYAASQVGLQHAKNGDPREDAYAVGGDPHRGRVFLAVADGLGSTNNAHAAARCASKTAVDVLRSRFDTDGMPSPQDWSSFADDVVTAVSRRLDPEAVGNAALDIGYLSPESRNGTKASKPPACTLTFAVAGPFSGESYPVYWAGVGDCELLFADLDSGSLTWKTHNATKTGKAISNATDSLPRNPDRVFWGAEMVSSNTMVVVASDGVGDAIRQVPEQFSRLLSQAPTAGLAEHTFAELVAFDLPGLHDDRTLVAAWPTREVGADICGGVR
jgi:hypothetical protein